MNKFINRRLMAAMPFLFALLLLCFPATRISAQEGGPAAPVEAEPNRGNQRGDLMRVLGLTPEQVAKIRTVRQQNQEERRLAGERLRSAQRALDEAIYSEDASEALIEGRAREVAAAMAATIRLRALTELNIRRVLTPEQLGRLRALQLQQTQQTRRLGRELNQQRRLRNRERGNPDGAGLPLPRDRFRRRDNAPVPLNDNARPAAAPPPERRNDAGRKAQP
jgi:Spy/CpxP family protein refolding chaperone